MSSIKLVHLPRHPSCKEDKYRQRPLAARDSRRDSETIGGEAMEYIAKD